MAELAPEDQDQLAQLFGGKLGGNPAALFAQASRQPGTPSPLMQPGMPGGPPDASGMPVAGPRTATVPYASDDPTLQVQPTAPSTPMPGAPTLPAVPKFQSPPLGTMQDLSGRIAQASQPIRRQDYKPEWWQRLLAPAVAGVEGYGDAKQGIAAGRGILDRNYNRALENQQKNISPLQAEFDRQSKIEPYLRDVNENSQRTFEDTMQGVRESREQKTADTNAQYKSDLNEIKQNIADDKLDQAQKKLDQTAKDNQGKLDIQRELLAVRQQLADARDRQVDKGRDGRLIEQKHQDDLAKAEKDYIKAIRAADENTLPGDRSKASDKQRAENKRAHDEAYQTLSDEKDRIESAYRAEIVAAGGTVNPAGGAPAAASGATAPPAASAASPSATPPPASAAAKPKVGDFGNVKGVGRVQITKVLPDGKIEYKKAPK